MYIAWLKDLRMADLDQVGGKNASLGEMIGGLAQAGIMVPGGVRKFPLEQADHLWGVLL